MISFSNRLAGLAAGDGIIVPFLNEVCTAHHTPGVRHSSLVIKPAHQDQGMLIIPDRLVELSRLSRDKTEIGPKLGWYALFRDTEGNRVGLHSPH